MLEMHLNNISGPGCPLSSDPDCIEGQSQNNTTLAPPWGRPVGWGRPRQTWEGGRWEKTQIYWTGRGVNTQHSTLNTRHLTDRWWPMEVEVTELELNWALHQNL